MHDANSQIDQTARSLLEEIRQLREQLHPGLPAGQETLLDSTLDRDLGFDSLGRMELLRRIEARFAVSLREQALVNAVTARDLLRAILHADQGHSLGLPEQLPQRPAETAQLTVPEQARTLPEILDWHLSTQPDRPHIHFYADQGDGEILSYRQLHDGARRVAAALQQRGLGAGAPVAIMLPSEADYFYSFWGVLLAGGVPVPIYPPTRMAQMEDHLRRQLVILGNCGASHLITMPEALLFGRLLKSNLPQLRDLLTSADLVDTAPDSFLPPRLQERDTAFLQYTSGSTGNPKGVILSHANLLANIRAMGRATNASARDLIVSWLPLYHDMGLIGCWLTSLYFATPLVLLSPLEFLARPLRWLHAIHRYRATLSPAPNFAYEICLSRLRDEDLAGLDLSSWRCAFNGAEAVSPVSVERFSARFAPYGFRREAMMPVYGMAESSVGLAFPPLNRGPLIDHIDRDLFARKGRAEPVAADQQSALRIVACGRPLSGHEIRVVDPSGHELPERRNGRVQFRGPSACSGYFRNPQATAALFDGDWLDSGDLGYISGGDIFITGRSKDLIIIAGRNIHPQELEGAIAELPGIRKGNVVVFGTADRDSGTERLVVLAETRESAGARLEELRSAINELAVGLAGSPPHELLFVPPKTIPKTSSGKLRRAATRELYEQGLLSRTVPPWRAYLRLAGITLAGQLRRTRQATVETAFALWSWGLFTLLVPPVYLATLLLPSPRWRWAFIRRGLRLLARGTGTSLLVQGLELLPAEPCILVANHASYLDGFALSAALPGPFGFVAKRELAASPLLRIPLQRLGTEFVERVDWQQGIEDARHLGQCAKAGSPLVFFPEGTFTRMPGLRPFHMGAFVTAAEARMPLVPMVIRGTRSILRGDDRFPHRGRISIQIGPAIRPQELPPEAAGGDTWEQAITLRNLCRSYILQHCGEPDLGGEACS